MLSQLPLPECRVCLSLPTTTFSIYQNLSSFRALLTCHLLGRPSQLPHSAPSSPSCCLELRRVMWSPHDRPMNSAHCPIPDDLCHVVL